MQGQGLEEGEDRLVMSKPLAAFLEKEMGSDKGLGLAMGLKGKGEEGVEGKEVEVEVEVEVAVEVEGIPKLVLILRMRL